jgi:alpha-D-ribose 1-methylphosphonate 5-triphosphate synthase subunit PhnG
MTYSGYTRERVAELLAEAPEADLVALADAALADGADFAVLTAPEVGSVAARVREPICFDHFFLGDILACRAEVSLAGVRGWAMRMGDERGATLAAAVLDAELQAGRPQADAVIELAKRVEADLLAADAAEWAQLAPTIVKFEELT